MLRFSVAIARYHQAERRWPDDVHQLVPRYLDGQVLNRKNKVWGILRQSAGIYPSYWNPSYGYSTDNEYTRAVTEYDTKYGRLPQSAEDLRAAGADDTVTSNSRRMFYYVPERPVLFGVQRQTLHRGNPRLDGKTERRIPPGNDRIDVLAVECTWPESERSRPDIIELLR